MMEINNLHFANEESFFTFVRGNMLKMGIATLTVIRGIVGDSETIKSNKMEKKKTEANVTKLLMNIDDLSVYISRKKSWIYQNIREIPHNKNGQKGNLYFHKNEIDKWLSQYDVPAV